MKKKLLKISAKSEKSNKIFQLNYQIEKQKQNVKNNEIPKGHKHR